MNYSLRNCQYCERVGCAYECRNHFTCLSSFQRRTSASSAKNVVSFSAVRDRHEIHFLILPSAFFLSVPTITGWPLKQLVRILPGPVTERLVNRSPERISKAANAICLKHYSSFLRSKEAPA